MNFLFKNRIKPIVIIQLIVLVPLIIIGLLVFKMKDQVDFFYLGMFQGISAFYWILTAIENFLLKKKAYSIVFFILAVMFIYFSINSFYTWNVK